MGYTHYWRINNEINQDVFRAVADDVKKACKLAKEKFGLEVKWESDSRKAPEFSSEAIRFNGIDEEGHETFLISQTDRNFNFCKTARKPYDILVTASLCILHFHASRNSLDVGVSSDGTAGEWGDGLNLARLVIPQIQLPPEIE